MENFTPVSALIGGALIGLSAVLMLLGSGRIAGISGILGGALKGQGSERTWRLCFLSGLAFAALSYPALFGVPVVIESQSIPLFTALAGLLVGFGTRLGSGCTSGHGICGLARFSKRSFAATATFMLFGFATVFILRHVLEVQV